MQAENDSFSITTEWTLQGLDPSLTNMSTSESCSNIFSSYQFVLIPVLYCIIFTLGLVGNSLVIMVLCRQRSPKNVARVYLLNLALADLLALTTIPFWAAYYAYGYNWLFGSTMCKISSSILCLTMFASIFLITCMSVNRYQAIVHPFQTQRGTLHRAFRTALLVWGLAAVASLPTFYFRDIGYIPNLGVTACVMAFPSNNYSKWSAGIALMKNTLGFLIPVTIILTCYIWIGVHLTKARVLGRNKQKRDRVLKLVASVVVAFLICWLPFHILTFLDALAWMKVISNCRLTSLIDTALPFGISMGFANSCINPLLYYFIGSQFQDKIQHLFKLRLSKFKSTRQSFCSTKSSSLKDTETRMDAEEGDTERPQTHPL
ncbi:type-2 angiotensin II receptor [Hemicordylus capensis]|uniref:type-2 angiotensin II receptor n=1 Tax=Hemicordylus capensis TaxID=884348 RepID=UPI00230451E7|nr:type-2 angiotensin II receptor [Hemicordylus capensis]XP_053129310.1 type-2 angiotensin II receptor [Hemicordylus capensis]XP_053129311.1 type-2 angiotensin II receptor [Hemicordylus capensis]